MITAKFRLQDWAMHNIYAAFLCEVIKFSVVDKATLVSYRQMRDSMQWPMVETVRARVMNGGATWLY